MVGVAGKSKGCSTCRKRKKGCDLARPACGQCLKSGHICGGYQRDLTFIHHKIPGKERQQPLESTASHQQLTSRLDDDISSTAAASDQSSSVSSLVYSQSPATSDYQDWDESSALVQQTSSPTPPLQMLSQNLTLTALTTLHTSLFNSFFLPRKSFTIQGPAEPYAHPANWTQFVPQLLTNDLSLQLAYLALSSSRIGHDNEDDHLLASSKKFYGKALREMQRAISDPKRRFTEETLMACSILSLYEMFEAKTSAVVQLSSTSNGWLSHAAGAARLLEARGPESYTTDKGHQVFLHARILITIRASTARKAGFLSKPQWLTVPWKNHPKNMQHKLVDVMVFLPVVLETYDNCEANTSLSFTQRRRARQSLLAKCGALTEQLLDWYKQLRANAKGRSLWHQRPSDDPSHPFPHLYSFDDPLIGYTVMLYWTCSLVIQGTMLQLQHFLNEDLADVEDAVALPEYINPPFYACNIAQALPYLLHPDMGALGPNIALFPMGIAFGFFASRKQPSFVADWTAMNSLGPLMDVLMEGKGPHVDTSKRDIISWFTKLFIDLSSRSLPGGTFISGLMKALSNKARNAGVRSILEE
jgi:Fungal specific transcription factor domain/Fungal Zn(2)-Cys(6) binuclear cluster domain